MFTGLIQQVGKLNRTEAVDGGLRLFVRGSEWRPQLALGESVAVNGVCLTVSLLQGEVFACDVLQETLDKTTLGKKGPGCSLNLERALTMGSAMGGHMVTGHVDGTGTVVLRKAVGRDWMLRIACEPALLNGMVLKGSVACDGVSLTIADLKADSAGSEASSPEGSCFDVHLVPHTCLHTALSELNKGDCVNIETDIIGKYVYRYTCPQDFVQRCRRVNIDTGKSSITMDGLREAGFDE
ncbi:riboflavin synthase [Verrucomicrobiota bacterium]